MNLSLNVLISAFILSQYNMPIALFLIWVSLQQIYDLVFWHNLKPNKINYAFTKLAMITVFLQPIVLYGLIWYFKRSDKVSLYTILVYGLLFMIFIPQMWKKTSYTLLDKTGAPNWKWSETNMLVFMYILALIILLYRNFTFPENLIMVALTLGTLFFSMLYVKGTQIGRFWCWSACLIPLFLAFYYVNKK